MGLMMTTILPYMLPNIVYKKIIKIFRSIANQMIPLEDMKNTTWDPGRVKTN